MKEELERILNNKLDDINNDIDALVELNNKISSEKDKLSYASSILDLFQNDQEKDVMNFVRLSKDDFTKVLNILDGDVKELFTTDSCNYDGLVYLINGINSGVSLKLTSEQQSAINYLIQKLEEKKTEYSTAIEEFSLVKSRYLISDVDNLKSIKEQYLDVLDKLDKKHYVTDFDLIMEAMEYSELPKEKMIEVLKFLLEYNSDIYKNGTPTIEEKIEENVVSNDTLQFDDNINNQSFNSMATFDNYDFDNKEEKNEVGYNNDVDVTDIPLPTDEITNNNNDDYPEFHFNNIVSDDINNMHLSSYDYDHDNEKDINEDLKNEEINYTPLVDIANDDTNEISNALNEELNNDDLQIDTNASIEEKDLSLKIDDLMDNSNYENEENAEKISTNNLQVLLAKYGIQEDNNYINELVVGDINNYEKILDTLKNNDIIDIIKNNSELLIEILLYSDSESILNVLKIIKEDLSVDDDDYTITTKIVINTLPSIFVNHGGNYNNFIKNVSVFKELELNLINLFDFSKELFVANNDTIMNNLDIVKKYEIKITYQNAKYLLLLNNIGDRLDYYVESIYEDKDKNETFDGIEYINLYTAKLNVVTDETIKRLRYYSENGKKVFGNKPKSLVGEITNLKINSLDITTDYLNNFFNNEFAILTGDEVREYTKLIHNSSNVGNYSDELDILEKYHSGLRYVIDNINISYNKVLRNYSILRSYGIDTKKALHFAVCYNLVITKDEYDKLENILNELGGNL